MVGIWFRGYGERRTGASWVTDEGNQPRAWNDPAAAAQFLIDGAVPPDDFEVKELPELLAADLVPQEAAALPAPAGDPEPDAPPAADAPKGKKPKGG